MEHAKVPKKEVLLAEIEEIIRTKPQDVDLVSGRDDVLAWRGRASAVIRAWSIAGGVKLDTILPFLRLPNGATSPTYANQLRELLFEARHDLLMETGGTTSTALNQGAVFKYFDELNQRIALAKQDILFADPYLDAEFATRYLPQITNGVLVRLLTTKRVSALLPAVDLFTKQSGILVEVREAPFHDRVLFVDKRIAFQSGASFKDGAKTSPTALIEIVDVFAPMLAQYETLWSSATVHR